MNRSLYYFALLLLIVLPLFSFAHDHGITASPGKSSELSFIKNEGQWEQSFTYKAFLPGGAVFLTSGGFMYNFYSVADVNTLHDLRLKEQKDISNEKVRMHAYEVKFTGANKRAIISEDEKRDYYHNYFLGKDPSKWKGNVSLFGKITYHDIYPAIDLAVYNVAGQLKYDFILNKDADAASIALTFEGVQPQITSEGALVMKTSVGDITESAPYTYQFINGKRKIITSRYKKTGTHTIAFQLGAYDENYPVIIDPSLVFATYSGSTATTYGFSATYNNKGDLIDAGECFGVGWPVKTGAFQTTFGGQVDIGINRFNAAGTALLHATYLGGNDLDQPVSLICDLNQDLYVMAITSSNNFPVSQGCYDNSQNGDIDYAVTHLNNTFTSIVGSSYIGGSSQDGSPNPKGEIYLDNLNNIYIAGYTESSDYPTTFGSVQPTFGGISDGVVSIFNNSCTNLIGSTFLGGAGDESLTGIRQMPNGNIVVAGTSTSNNYITTPNAYQPVSNTSGISGRDKGVVTVMNTNLTGVVASTYIQAPDTNSASSLQFVDYDRQNNLYIYGTTDTTFPISAGRYSNAYGKTLLAKLPPTLDSLSWSTRIGANTNTNWLSAIIPTAFLADNCGKIYLAGYSGISSYPLTANAISTNPVGFWIGVLDSNAANLTFATFFGSSGDHLDGGTSRFDKRGIIYHAVCCGNNTFPGTTGAAYPNNLTNSYDIVGYKLDGETQSVVALNAASPSLSSCTVPFTITFTNYSQNASSYYWDFGDGTTDTTANPSHTFTVAGNYNVMLVAIDSLTCNGSDTTYLPVQILSNDFEVRDVDTTICMDGAIQPIPITAQPVSGGSNIYYTWLPNPAIIGATNAATVIIDPAIDSVFTVIATDSIFGLCSVTDTAIITVRVMTRGSYYALPDTTIMFCPGQYFQLFATGDSNTRYTWIDPSGTSIFSDTNVANPYVKPQQTTQFIVYIYNQDRTCFIADTVHAMLKPSIDLITADPVYLCLHDTIMLDVTTSTTITDYKITWKDISGEEPKDMISGANTLTPLVSPTESRQYVIEVSPENSGYCKGTDTIDVLLYPFAGLEAGPDEVLRLGESIELNAEGNGNFIWTPGTYLSNTTIHNPTCFTPEDITYYVTVTTTEGCVETDSLKVYVTQLAFPSAFTPNGDGRNDILRLIIRNDRIELEKILIVDRFGHEVFKTSDLREGWDGTYDGTYAETGVYFYYIKYKIGRKSYLDKGDVTLIR